MKKTEKIIAALLTIALGIILIVLKGSVISIAMTVLGIGLIVLGCIDLYNRRIPPCIIKIVVGVVVILFGWLLVSAVLYVLAAALIIVGCIMLYELIKRGERGCNLWQLLCKYAMPVLCLLIGILLLFNQGGTIAWVFIISGILVILEGGIMLLNAVLDD